MYKKPNNTLFLYNHQAACATHSFWKLLTHRFKICILKILFLLNKIIKKNLCSIRAKANCSMPPIVFLYSTLYFYQLINKLCLKWKKRTGFGCTDKENVICLFTDVLVARKSGGFRLAMIGCGGNNEQSTCIKQSLELWRYAFIHFSCQNKDNRLLATDKKIPNITLQPAAETTHHTSSLVPHLDSPIIALQHHLHRNDARGQECQKAKPLKRLDCK